jgi:hypothetical protein
MVRRSEPSGYEVGVKKIIVRHRRTNFPPLHKTAKRDATYDRKEEMKNGSVPS